MELAKRWGGGGSSRDDATPTWHADTSYAQSLHCLLLLWILFHLFKHFCLFTFSHLNVDNFRISRFSNWTAPIRRGENSIGLCELFYNHTEGDEAGDMTTCQGGAFRSHLYAVSRSESDWRAWLELGSLKALLVDVCVRVELTNGGDMSTESGIMHFSSLQFTTPLSRSDFLY